MSDRTRIWEHPGGILIYPAPCSPGTRSVEQTMSGYGYATCIGGRVAILEEQMQHVWPLPGVETQIHSTLALYAIVFAAAVLAGLAMGRWLARRVRGVRP